MYKTKFAILCLVVVALSATTACGPKQTKTGTDNNLASIATPIGEYPIETDEKLTYWSILNNNIAKSYANFGDTPIAKELERKTGVKVIYMHPAQGQNQEQFNILIASNDYPDIIEYNWTSNYPGGAEKAMDDQVIIPLNYLMTYSPNYKKELDSIEGLDTMAKTDSGKYYVYATIRRNYERAVNWGPMFRKDWLDELNLVVPETIEEWETVLRAFKDKKGASSPFMVMANTGNGSMMLYGAIVGAYKTDLNWYTNEKTMRFGPYEPQYKDFLATMARWYSEKLLDHDFPMSDVSSLESKVLSDKCGAFIGLLGSGMGTYLRVMETKNPKFDLVAGVNPTLNKGEESFVGDKGLPFYAIYAAGITTHSKNQELAARWLDFGYTQDGALINNFGVENESFSLKEGEPSYTDLVMNASAEDNMLAKYNRYNGPFTALIFDKTSKQTMLPQQLQARETFQKNMPTFRGIPPITLTVEESAKHARMMNNINNYVNEMRTKFIMGTESLSNYDQYLSKLKEMGMEEAIEIQQAALDRYYKR